MPPSPVTAPHPALMDSFYIDSSTEDSRQSRSRASSHLSATASQFQGLKILESTPSSANERLGSTEIHPSSSSHSFLNQGRTLSPAPLIDSPAPQQLTPFPLLSQSDLDADWTYLEATGGEANTYRLEPESYLGDQDSVSEHSTILRSNSIPANMSTMGIQQYDSRFDAGLRQAHTWPCKLKAWTRTLEAKLTVSRLL